MMRSSNRKWDGGWVPELLEDCVLCLHVVDPLLLHLGSSSVRRCLRLRQLITHQRLQLLTRHPQRGCHHVLVRQLDTRTQMNVWLLPVSQPRNG